MASQPSAPPNPTDDKPQNSVSEVVQSANEVQQDAKAEATKPNVAPSVFVNSEPMREDQVQNAMKFLSHPKVRGSPVMYRRSFLERKGLTKEEIDEAFRRVPDPPPSAQTATTNQDGQAKTSSSTQSQAPAQTLPVSAVPNTVAPSVGTLTKSRFHWYHAVIAVGVLAASGAGTAVLIKNAIIPRLKSWIRRVVQEEENDHPVKKPSLAEEAAAAAKAAAAAAADVAKASQEMLNSKTEERRYFGELMNLLDVQVQEMKSMSNAIRKLEGQTNNSGGTYVADQEDYRVSVTNSKQPYANGKAEFDSHPARSSSLSSSGEPSIAPHPKSYMEIMQMVQRGEKPSNIREINDLPPNPNQQPSNPRLAPRAKPWEVAHAPNSSNQVIQSQFSGEGLNSKVLDNGVMYQFDGDNSVPRWQQKNPRITDIENDDELKGGSYGGQTYERPIPRTWVPPQPPPVVMPEAVEAIRRPKPSNLKEQGAENQSAAPPLEPTQELQMITKVSESGGALETKGDELSVQTAQTTEIQEETQNN